jgi:hypothetical protein
VSRFEKPARFLQRLEVICGGHDDVAVWWVEEVVPPAIPSRRGVGVTPL